jgi:C1A family cysteine protease
MEHAVASDSGAQIRDGLKSIRRHGFCAEKSWPYRVNKFAKRPPRKCYIEAVRYRGVSYHRVRRTLKQMKACLASGYPFIFGFTVYESFHSKKVRRTGRASMPVRYEKKRGDHAVVAVGYEERQRRFIVRNSWGRKWGMRGYFTLPYAYLTSRYLSEDFWTIRIAT